MLYVLTWAGAISVRIDRLSVPSSVENGTADSVILDCIYSYSHEDQQLVVKWFFNQDPKPIYQWIPDLKKRSYSSKSGFDGHINRSYVATHDPLTRYRALNILRPTTEMSGTYSCSVTSLQGQDTRAADMIVYGRFYQIQVECLLVQGRVERELLRWISYRFVKKDKQAIFL